jgi:hypothetical protein
MDEFVKKEVMEELCTVQASNPKVIDRITYLIRGDFPEYIKCLKTEIKEAHEISAKLEARIKQLEKEGLYNQVLLRRLANDLEMQANKMQQKAPFLNRLK